MELTVRKVSKMPTTRHSTHREGQRKKTIRMRAFGLMVKSKKISTRAPCYRRVPTSKQNSIEEGLTKKLKKEQCE
jgi:hypothetical protein